MSGNQDTSRLVRVTTGSLFLWGGEGRAKKAGRLRKWATEEIRGADFCLEAPPAEVRTIRPGRREEGVGDVEDFSSLEHESDHIC